MGLLRRDRTDDVDIESCLANLHRLEAIGSRRVVVDLRPVRHRIDVDLDAFDGPAADLRTSVPQP